MQPDPIRRPDESVTLANASRAELLESLELLSGKLARIRGEMESDRALLAEVQSHIRVNDRIMAEVKAEFNDIVHELDRRGLNADDRKEAGWP